MLDIRFVRDNAEKVQQNASNKGYDVSISEILKWDETKRQLQQQADELRARRNEIATRMKGERPSDDLVAEGKAVKEQLAAVEANLKEADERFVTLLKAVPNMAAQDVPVGASENENVTVKTVGTPPVFDFTPRSHYEIAEELEWIDKERAARVTGARFAYIKGDLVRLQMAVVNFVLDTLTNSDTLQSIGEEAGLGVSTNPFIPVLPPLLVRTDIYDAMDRLEPRDDRYKLEGEDLWLQGSAEHVLGSMHAGEIFEEKDLPRRYIGYATSFRREAGSYGKDMEGILRMHQFDKLEMESFTTAEDGYNEHLFFVAIQEYLLQQLGLPYRVVEKCTADIGKPNARGIDMDTWMPGQDTYRETHTADYMTDYQARRLKTRVRRGHGGLELVHTNDATAFALGRIMIAIIENTQTPDGRVSVPVALRPYLGGRSTL